MKRPTSHLPPWTLDALAEGELSHSERSLAQAHLEGCPHCQAQLDEMRAVAAALDALPRFEPSGDFAAAVMARVAIRPVEAPAAAPARRWLPRTRRGWMFLGAGLLAPLAPLVARGGRRALGGGGGGRPDARHVPFDHELRHCPTPLSEPPQDAPANQVRRVGSFAPAARRR